MRPSRILSSAVAALVLGSASLVPSTAGAAAPRASSAVMEAEEKPARAVKFEFKPDGRTTYKFYGKVQAAQNKKIVLMRADRRFGQYRVVKVTRTNARGNYSWSRQRAEGYFYVKVPSDARFATSYSQLIHVYYD